MDWAAANSLSTRIGGWWLECDQPHDTVPHSKVKGRSSSIDT